MSHYFNSADDQLVNSLWNIDEASVLTMTYSLPKTAVDQANNSVRKVLSYGDWIQNTISLVLGNVNTSDVSYYSEKESSSKSGAQTGSDISYIVNFNNAKQVSSNPSDTGVTTKMHLLPIEANGFTGAYLKDNYDSRFTIDTGKLNLGDGIDYGIAAYVYSWETNLENIGSRSPVATYVIPYSKLNISGNSLTAYWSDFYLSNGSSADSSQTLEALMEANSELYCIQFHYYMKPVDSVSMDGVNTIINSATFGWTETESIELPPAESSTTYTQRVISKSGKLTEGTNIMSYVITVNEGNEDLLDGKATVTVDDQMSGNLVLDYSSIDVRYPAYNISGSYFEDFSSFDAYYAALNGTLSESAARTRWDNY